ncbi:MAG: thermonuclease family protein [Marinovum sp.]|nr:thermonuclease family protein [Marinovum sp.]
MSRVVKFQRPKDRRTGARRRMPNRDTNPRSRADKLAVLALGLALAPLVGDLITSLIRPSHDGARVLTVVDGDTVRIYRPGFGFENARLLGFDTPELKARCFSEFVDAILAKQYLRRLIWTSSSIQIHGLQRDKYGRPLVALVMDGRKLADLMVGAERARPYWGGIRTGWCA